MKQFSDDFSPGSSQNSQVNATKEFKNLDSLPSSDNYQALKDASLFSSSLPVLPHEQLDLNDMGDIGQYLNYDVPTLDKMPQDVGDDDLFETFGAHATGSLLPGDEDELLAGITDDFDLSRLPSSLEDLEDYDVFGSGGIELENDPRMSLRAGFSKLNLSDGAIGNGASPYILANGVGTVAGEHPYGEHPSRTLFVRNINSNVEDSELRVLFEQYGDIKTLYTSCKHRGFVMISYFDIRAARTAMRALQNKPLRKRKLDIHYSIPKDNPSDKDMNQGTLVAFNLDPSVPNEDLLQIFGTYGEVKEIRETPHKRHHRFIEFYDIRAAEAALKSLNRVEIAGKRIKLEPSRPGGTRRNLMLHLNQEIDQDEFRSLRNQVGSPITNSPPGSWAQFNSPIEHSPLQTTSISPVFRTISPSPNNHLPGLASILHSQGSNSVKVPPIGKEQERGGLLDCSLADINSAPGYAFQQPQSLPESTFSQCHGLSSFGPSATKGSTVETLSGPQFLWGSPKPYSEHTISTACSTSALGQSPGNTGHGFSYTGRNVPFLSSSQHLYHVGSAPSGAPLERHLGFVPKSPGTSFNGGVPFRSSGLNHYGRSFMMNTGAHAPRNSGISIQRNIPENGSSNYRMASSPSLSPVFLGNGSGLGLTPNSSEGFFEQGRSRQANGNGVQVENRKQFQLDLDKIIRGEDTRTTLMIKNIPNKYTSKMLLAAIDEYNKGTYDFLYLPIDFKNKCNVGYAFINMLSPSHIIPFYEAFNGKRWEKFNSEKVASLAYARIQGKAALVSHFQNSSLMNEDKRCRPILFHSEGQDTSDQELLTSSYLNIQFHQLDGPHSGDAPGSLMKDGSDEKSDNS